MTAEKASLHMERTARGDALVHGYLNLEELAIAGPLMEALREPTRMGLFRKLLRWAAHALKATRALGRTTQDVLGQLVLNLDTATPATSNVGAFTEHAETEAEAEAAEALLERVKEATPATSTRTSTRATPATSTRTSTRATPAKPTRTSTRATPAKPTRTSTRATPAKPTKRAK